MTDSFIAEARREQIILACINTLEEVGYNNLSLTKVARKAKISTGLISYHFNDKLYLMNRTLQFLVEKQNEFISNRVLLAQSEINKLETFIEAHLAYQETHYKNNIALIEIVFNARNEENIPYYRIEDEEDDDALRTMLLDILKTGQQNGVFSNSFRIDTLASFILGAIEERMLKANSSISIENYSDELIKMVKKLTM
ncbi:transcriptional regulator [Bacillus tropicus]|uniref:TetR/AcrR family transcriptional regulator n=1 Tax=Bacillus cereus group TaxID=86661 RepID=UPI0018CEE5D3|nr:MULTISPECIES: TetR/AcrR family transcriptional regulator [Bacillus cereus group]MBG9839001.1 transcriptional regulator [Bacillus tropicus]MBG9880357.1 transcriptional regulator [Bacillus tropicus]MBG9920915.1 transcriptional regulator [Bacillus tropicus]MBJ8353846.1 transcriptional regulator [Bacillus mycoides]